MAFLNKLQFGRRKSCEVDRLAGPVPSHPLSVQSPMSPMSPVSPVSPKSPMSSPLYKKPSVASQDNSFGRRLSAPASLSLAGSAIIDSTPSTFEKKASLDSTISNLRQGRLGSKTLPWLVERRMDSRTQVSEETMSNLRDMREVLKFKQLTLDDLDLQHTIGVGSFGQVRMCTLKDHVMPKGHLGDRRSSNSISPRKRSKSKSLAHETSSTLAVKMVNKYKAMQNMGGIKFAVKGVCQEVQILKSLEFPFVVNLITMFHDDVRVCLLMEFVNGGELYNLIYQRLTNVPSQIVAVARHFSAELLLTLEELHSKRIMFRDLKPENVLLDANGHAKVVDFGLAKRLENCDRASTNCGTLVYQAPEILLNKNYGFGVDYWALGVIVFEMLAQKPPWGVLKDPFEISQAIMSLNVKYPWSLDKTGKNFVKKLLVHDEKSRWGASAKFPITTVKSHKFFDSVNWDDLVNLKTNAPYKPEVKDEMDPSIIIGDNGDKYPDSVHEAGQVLSTKDKQLWECNLQEVMRNW